MAALAGHRSPAAGPACTLAPMPHVRLPLDPSTMQTLFMPRTGDTGSRAAPAEVRLSAGSPREARERERPRPLSAAHAAHADEEESIGGNS
jgi:hypothetical protein